MGARVEHAEGMGGMRSLPNPSAELFEIVGGRRGGWSTGGSLEGPSGGLDQPESHAQQPPGISSLGAAGRQGLWAKGWARGFPPGCHDFLSGRGV